MLADLEDETQDIPALDALPPTTGLSSLQKDAWKLWWKWNGQWWQYSVEHSMWVNGQHELWSGPNPHEDLKRFADNDAARMQLEESEDGKSTMARIAEIALELQLCARARHIH